MSEYLQMNLKNIIEEIGENSTKAILSQFSSPQNRDVEYFIREKAIEFSKQGLAGTQLVFYRQSDEDALKLVGYYALGNKIVKIHKKALSSKLRSRIKRFAKYNFDDNYYVLPVILIGQLSKNYADGNNKYITGSTLLSMAFMQVENIQKLIGGKFVYLECEDCPKLLKFYMENGFVKFGDRRLNGEEVEEEGVDYLVQLIRKM